MGVDTLCINLKANNDLFASLSILVWGAMSADDQSDVVVDEVSGLARDRTEFFVAHLETSGIIFASFVCRDEARGSWEIVYNPFRDVTVVDDVVGFPESSSVDLVTA